MKQHAQSELTIWNNIRDDKCRACPLHEGVKHVCLLGDGPVPCQGMIIGEAPGHHEDQNGIPFCGDSGIFLRKMLKEVGLDPRQLYITNTVACRPPGNRTPKRSEAKTCSQLYLTKQVDLVKPRAILLLGATAVSWAKNKKTAVKKLEGSTFTLDEQPTLFPSTPFDIICVPSRHPAAVIRMQGEPGYARHVEDFKQNLQLFKRSLNLVKEEFNFSREVPRLEPGRVYTDLESNGLSPFRPNAKIHCVGWAQYPSSVSSYMMDAANHHGTVEILEKHPIIAHRTTFEGTWYLWHFGVKPRIYHDTKVCAYVIDENEPSGLKYQAIKNLGVEPWSEDQDFENPDPEKLLPYNARDNSYGMRLYKERDLPFLKKNPKIARLLRYIVFPAIEVFIEIICNGFHIDTEEAQKRLEHCLAQKKKINKQINKIAGWEVNPGSPPQMARLLYDQLGLKCPVRNDPTKKNPQGSQSTSEAALVRLRGMHPVTDLLWDWRGWDKKRSTYLEPWIRQGPDLHANYGFTDTDTGRLNSSMVKNKRGEKKTGGVIHQCPRDPFIRTIICARGYRPTYPPPIRRPIAKKKDWCLVAFDWSQIELRLVAHVSQEPTMIEIFSSGGDIHLATAMNILGKSADQIDKETRKKAKAVNFGFVYGMFAPKFQIYCLEKFDLKITFKEAKNYRKGYFALYSGLKSWHNRVEAFVTQNGYIDSVFGRRRHLPTALNMIKEICPDCKGKPGPRDCFDCGGTGFTTVESPWDDWVKREAVRQAINSPIQSAGSDLLLWLMALVFSESLKSRWKADSNKAFPVGSAHDSGLCEVRRDYVEEFKQGIQDTADNLPTEKYFGFKFRVPIKMDVTVYESYWEGKVLEHENQN